MSSKAQRIVLIIVAVSVLATVVAVFLTGRAVPWLRSEPATRQSVQPVMGLLHGVVQDPARRELRAVAAGTVVALGASETMPVAGGQLIVQIDSAEIRARVQAARRGLLTAQTQTAAARAGAIQSQIRVAEADVQSAQAMIIQSKQQIAEFSKQEPVAAGALARRGGPEATLRQALSDHKQATAAVEAVQGKANVTGQAGPDLDRLQADLQRAEHAVWQAQSQLASARDTRVRLREPIAQLVRLNRGLERNKRRERQCRDELQKLRQSPAALAATKGDTLIAEAQAQLAEAERLMAAGAITAPAAGRLLELRVRPGMKVAAGQAVAKVEDRGGPRLVFAVPAAQMAALSVGQRARVTVADAAKRQNFPAAISQIVAGHDHAQVYMQPLGKASLPPAGTALTARLR